MGRNSIAGPALVLGGGGFLGSHLVEQLLSEGCTVRVFDRARPSPAPPVESPAEYIEGDFGNRADVKTALDGCRTIFHLIGTTLPKTSNDDPVHDLESNLVTTVRMLELARHAGVERVVFASSGGTVYGVPTSLPIAEHHDTQPLCSYGIHKLAIERYLHLYRSLHGLDYCVLRLANPFGERQRPDASQGAVSVFLDKALRGEEIVVWGDGSVVRDYIYAGDVARAFSQAAKYQHTVRTFNIGSGQGLSVNALIAAIERVVGRAVARRYLPGRPFDVPTNVLDISRAAQYLGWRPHWSFEDGLRRTLDWQVTVRTGDQPAVPMIR